MALVVDQDTDEVLYEKNADHVSSIASITKLMTAIGDAGRPVARSMRIWKLPARIAPTAGPSRGCVRAPA